MRLKQLDIIGFKSFKDRATLRFENPITGVVGPNGCGKSNVVDSLLWCMGEMSPKNLRGKSLEDVIFNGSENHSPLSRAEVRLSFHLDDHEKLPEMYRGLSEVTVGRVSYRKEGGSDYTINGHQCRQRDVLELFMNTGVGTRGYAIIEQGRIGMIVTARPEDRRRLIEEAAGIALYRSRRIAAERKMEATKANLDAVKAIIDELQRHIETLRKQAAQARRYKILRAELMQLDLAASATSFKALQDEFSALAARIDEATRERDTTVTAAEQAEVALEIRKGERARLDDALKALRDSIYELKSRISLAEQAIAHGHEEVRRMHERRERLASEGEALVEQLAALEAEEKGAVERASSLEATTSEDQSALESTELRFREESAALAEMERALDEQKRAAMEAVARAAECRQLLSDLDRRRNEAIERHAMLAREFGELDTHLSESEARVAEAQTRLEARKRSRGELRVALDDAMKSRETLRGDNQKLAQEIIVARDELSKTRSRLHSLEELQNNYQGYEKGVRAVMSHRVGATGGTAATTKSGERLNGVLALVTDLIEARAEHLPAIEALLGERLQAIVVENEQAAVAALEFLKRRGEGRSSFLPLDLSSRATVTTTAPVGEGVVAPLIDLVRYKPEHAGLVHALLDGAYLATDLAAALKLNATDGFCGTLVTLDGEVLHKEGMLSGGSTEEVRKGFLQRKAEIRTLHETVQTLDARVVALHEKQESLRQAMVAAEHRIDELRTTGHEEDKNIVTDEKDLSRAHEEMGRMQRRREMLTRDIERLNDETQAFGRRHEETAGHLEKWRAQHAKADERQAELSQAITAARAHRDEISAALTQIKVKAAQAAERRGAVQNQIIVLRNQIRVTRERIESGAKGVTEALDRVKAQHAHVDAQAEQLTHDKALLAELDGQRVAREAEADEVARQLAALENDLRQLRARADTVQQSLSEATMRRQHVEFERIRLVERVRDNYEVDLATVEPPEEALPQEELERAEKIRVSVAAMKNVNLAAIEEFDEQSKRLEELMARHEELSQAIAKLRRAIQKINRVSVELFERTFEAVNRRFSQVFPRLFNGGSAGLQLVREEGQSVLEAGIEIMAQPPGKKLTRLSMMSGGERALTALSLVFAIFLIKPSPFCVLDEVDAPLDDVNVARFNRLLREMSQRTQFIVITHNKATMAACDVLYGVTMQEAGVSSLVPFELKSSEREKAKAEMARVEAAVEGTVEASAEPLKWGYSEDELQPLSLAALDAAGTGDDAGGGAPEAAPVETVEVVETVAAVSRRG